MGLWLAWVVGGAAQDSANATAIAAQQEAEERYKKLSAALEDLKEIQADLAKKFQTLEKELQRVRDESAQAGGRYASTDDLKQLTEKLREVDVKRQTDNEKVLTALDKLAKAVAAQPSLPTRPPPSIAKNDKGGYWYEVRANDTISGIVKAYRDQGIKVTLKQVLEANSTINPTKLKPGEKVWIPDSAQ